jgi:hypothetical protein
MPEILPDSRPRKQKDVIFLHGIYWTPIFCANCGADGGFVPSENCNFAFYLCTPCSEKWQVLPGTHCEPDTIFWQKVHDEQIEKYGRELTTPELIEVLKDGHSTLSKLCKERVDFSKLKMS